MILEILEIIISITSITEITEIVNVIDINRNYNRKRVHKDLRNNIVTTRKEYLDNSQIKFDFFWFQ